MDLRTNTSGLSEQKQKHYDTVFERFEAFQKESPDAIWVLIDHDLNQVRLCASAMRVLRMPSVLSLDEFAHHFTPENKILEDVNLRAGSEFKYAVTDKEVLNLNVWSYQPDPDQPVRLLNLKRVDQHEPNKLSPIEEQLFSQRQLFSIISHELRTPTATMKMLIDDLEAGTQSSEHIEQMKKTTEHLLYVLEDINQAVNPSRSIPITRTRFHPNRLLENVHAQMRRLAEIGDIQLKLELIDKEDLLLESDTQRLKIIILNLIKNAILHSRGTCINVSADWHEAEKGEGELRIVVSDDGRGIPASDYHKIFEPFERLGTRVDGNGLGLYLVRQTLNEIGGSITTQESAEGGAQFSVTLPSLNYSSELMNPASLQPAQTSEEKLKTLRLLVVEDDPVIRMVSQRLLGKIVALVDVAENGQLGYEKAIANPYDLILTDYFMPVLDGLGMVKKLREQGVATPIVAVTAAVLGQEAEQLLSAGTSKVIAKPISMTAFIDVVDSLHIN